MLSRCQCCLHPSACRRCHDPRIKCSCPTSYFQFNTAVALLSSSLSTQLLFPSTSSTFIYPLSHRGIYVDCAYAISSYPLTSHYSYLTWLISECGHPSRAIFLNTLLCQVKEISILPTTSYPVLHIRGRNH